MADFVELYLTCETRDEAEKIADNLLARKLVACVKFEQVASKFHWKGQIETANEVKLSMTTIANNFDKIEAEVTKLHSYETFVLQQIPITRLNQAAAQWLADSVE